MLSMARREERSSSPVIWFKVRSFIVSKIPSYWICCRRRGYFFFFRNGKNSVVKVGQVGSLFFHSWEKGWVPVKCFLRLTPLNGNFFRQDPTSESLILILLSLFSRKEATKPKGRSLLAFPVRDASLFVITALQMFSGIREVLFHQLFGYLLAIKKEWIDPSPVVRLSRKERVRSSLRWNAAMS